MTREALIDAKEAAITLGISRRRIFQLIKSKDLPAVKLGGRWLINTADLQALINRPGPGRPKSGNQ